VPEVINKMEKIPVWTPTRPIHPKVLKARMNLYPSSPIRLVRDDFQPISGSLSSKPPSFPDLKTKTIEKNSKKEVHLDLSLNKMRSSRVSIIAGVS
jgi:hypothetical protein